MHIQKFSDEAMREVMMHNSRIDWPAIWRILLADVNAQIVAQTPAIAPGISDEELGRLKTKFFYVAEKSKFKDDYLQVFSRDWWELHDAIQRLLAAVPPTEQSPPAAEVVPGTSDASREDVAGYDTATSPADERPAPDATMQRVTEVLAKRLSDPHVDNDYSAHDMLNRLAADFGLEILPAQPIRVVVKGEG